MVLHGRTTASTPNRRSVRRRPSRGGVQRSHPLTVILLNPLLLLCISYLCIQPIRAISGGEELSSLEEEQISASNNPHLQSSSSLSAASSELQLFTIPDQQAYIGKLFYYHIATPAGLRNLSLLQAGHHLNLNGNINHHNQHNHHSHQSPPPLLPEWLHFNSETGELFGAPLEKKIYFIQVTAILSSDEVSHEQQQQHGKTYEDIFVIEVLDAPTYLTSASGQRLQSSSEHGSNLLLYQCRIELKAPFINIDALYETIVRLHGSPLASSSSGHHRDSKSNSLQLTQWLNRFNIEPAVGSSVGGWKTSYDVEQCGTNVQRHQQPSTKDHIYLDQNSEQLLSRLSEHRIESELVKISSSNNIGSTSGHQGQFDLDSSSGNGYGFSSMRSSEVSSGELPPKDQKPKRNSHRRRNAYADDPDAYSTPTLKGDWRSLTTSTIDLAASDLQVLSRTAIPSMVSPTFTGVHSSEVTPTPVFGGAGDAAAAPVGGRPPHPMYPHLYSTPVLMPDISSLSIRTYDEAAASILATPVIPQMVASTSVLLEVMGYPTQGAPSLAVPEPASNLTTADTTTTSTTSTSSSTTSTTEAGPPTSTLKPNHRPFVNRRIAKLSITAGKYWQYSIPESTFMDVEDGNTKALRLAFFKDSELPPIDYWIQFDHENQYLYALPTEENIGRYRFNLVAMDTAGAEVTETLEIYVRQPRESLTYTHRFILANVSWDANNLFVERIQAVSSLLQRMATQIFEEASSQQDPAEAVQKQTILHSISVLSITKSNGGNGNGNGGGQGHDHGHLAHHDSHFTAPTSASQQQSWTITWSNDSLRRTPCPEEEVNALFSKLYDITYPSDANGFMQPSPDLKNALSPEFSIMKVKREFIGRSACGSFASIGTGDGTFRQKEKIAFSNPLNRLGPYKVGMPFRFVIPKDTVYIASRQGDSSELDLSLAPVEPANYIPEWIFFDVREQTIYGLPYRQEHVQTLELKLIAEDRQTGGRETDIFVVDVILDKDTREDYLLEVTMSFAMRNVEKLDAGNLKLTAKDYYQLSHLIATRLLGNSNLEAFRMLEINRYRFTKMDDLIIETFTNNDQSLSNNAPLDPLDSPKFEDPKANQQLSSKSRRSAVIGHSHHDHDHHHQHLSKQQKKRRRSYHHLRFKRGLFQTGAHGPDYFYEFIWTNRSLVTSYLHSANAYGGGTLYETDSCPKDDIKRDLYDRLFPRSTADFAASVNLVQNGSHLDVMEIYSRLFESIEANVEFLSVEWTPKSVCQYTPGLDARTFGAKPIKEFESDFPPPPGASPQTPPQPPPTAEPPGTGHPDDDLDHFPTDYSSTYLGDKLLTMIIPPIAILTALLFAVTIGCCFHRANLRRKAMGNMTEITEENPNLYRQRIPIQFEFERGGGGPGSIRSMGVGEQEAMLDGSKMGRHPIQIMPMKRGIGGAGGHPPPLPGHGGRSGPKGMVPGQHMQYQMLPQQHQ